MLTIASTQPRGVDVAESFAQQIQQVNQQTYQQLQTTLELNLRRQIFLGICDDLGLRDRIIQQLQRNLAAGGGPTSAQVLNQPKIVLLQLDAQHPDPFLQMAVWLQQQGQDPSFSLRSAAPIQFQLIGIEHLTQYPASVQRRFLNALRQAEQHLPYLEASWVVWLTRPWAYAIRESAPEFWRWRSRVFEFIGNPTPSLGLTPVSSQPATPPPSPPAPSANRELWSILTQDLEHLESPAPRSQPQPPTTRAIAPTTSPSPEPVPTSPLATTETVALETSSTPTLPVLFPALFNADSDLSDLIWVTPPTATTAATAAIAYPPPSPALQAAAPVTGQDTTTSLTPTPLTYRMPTDPQVAPTPAKPAAGTLDLILPAEVANQPTAIAARQSIQDELAQPQPAPAILLHAYRVLGNLLRDRLHQGDTTVATLTTALQAYEQSLTWAERLAEPLPDVLNDVGNLHWLRSRQARDGATAIAALQQSLQAYQRALTQVDLASQPSTYAMVQHNLGTAYGDLAQYEAPVEHLQSAIYCYQQALNYRSAETNRVQYAATQNNLGTAYWRLAQHDHSAVYLQQAIAAYREALLHAQIEDNPLHYAMIQNNLGTAYWQLAQHDSPQDHLQAAIDGYEIALQYRTLEQHPAAHAATQNNLGAAQRQLAQLTIAEPVTCRGHLMAAIQAYTQAIAAAQRSHTQSPQTPLNFDIGNTHQSLALVLMQLVALAPALPSAVPPSDIDTHLDQALAHHLAAIALWQTRPELRQAAFNGVIQVIRTYHAQAGLEGQNRALSQIPPALLPELLPQL